MSVDNTVVIVQRWVDDHPGVKDAVEWRPCEIRRLVGNATRYDASHYFGLEAHAEIDGKPAAYLRLNMALDNFDVVAVQLIADSPDRTKSCAADLTHLGDLQAAHMLDTLVNNLTRFKWKKVEKRELRAPQ